MRSATSVWVATVLGSNRKRPRPAPKPGRRRRSPGSVINTMRIDSRMLSSPLDQAMRPSGPTRGGNAMPWPFHKDLNVPEKGDCSKGGLSLGVMCSLSIPIVTIAALILLIIIVSLLDLVFRWMPFLVACFPLPGFKGRK